MEKVKECRCAVSCCRMPMLWSHHPLTCFGCFTTMSRNKIVGISEERIEGECFLHDSGVELNMSS